MSEHRYPCMAALPVVDVGDPGHIHACKHDATGDPFYRIPEHECECGMTWRDSPIQWQVYSNIPPEGKTEWARAPGFWSRLWSTVREVFGVIP